MAGKVVGWAFEQARELELSPTQRFILVAYADNASEAEGKCWPDKEEIIEKTGYSRATVFRAVKELEGADLILFTEDSKGRECAFLKVPWQSHSETGESHSETGKSQSEKSTNNSEPSKKRHRKTRPKKEVNRKAVSDDEYTLAAAVVSMFNEEAGTALSVDAHLTPIVGRIRETPRFTEATHRKIIRAVFAGDHWWTGAPTPKIIYGNPAIYEQSIELGRAAAKERESAYDVNAEAARIRREQGLE